jgi:hypothetical protein
MATKSTTVKSKPAAAKKAAPVVKKTVVEPVVVPTAKESPRKWLSLSSLIAGGLAFIGFVLLSNLTIQLSETLQIVTVFIFAVLCIAGVVTAILALLPGKDMHLDPKWLGISIIGLVVSFVMFDKFLTPLISVIGFLLKKPV